MKKFLLVALIALFVAGSVYAAGPTGPNAAGDILGQAKYADDPHRIFRMVHFGDNSTASGGLTAGQIVIWDTLLDDGVSVTTTTTSGDMRTAGIVVTAINSGDTSANLGYTTASDDVGMTARWGWLQTYGLSVSDPTCAGTPGAGGITVAYPIAASGIAGQITQWSLTLTAAAATTTVNAYGIAGFAMDAIADGATGEVFLMLN